MAHLDSLHDANFPRDHEGRVYHLGVKKGDVARRVLTVGDTKRAELIANAFLQEGSVQIVRSHRGFVTFTGLHRGTPVSIIATGMGRPMMDFMVRECRAVVTGPMAFIRVGTAGGVNASIPPGTVVCAYDGSVLIERDARATQPPFYKFSDISKPSPILSELLAAELKQYITHYPVHLGLDATADSFYSSQGRIDSSFEDHNETVIQDLQELYPNVASLQMETYQLFELSRIAAPHAPIASAACAIIMFNRITGEGLPHADLRVLELACGKAALAALLAMPLEAVASVNK